MPNHPGIAIVLLSGFLTAGALAQQTIDPNNLNGSDKEPVGKAIQPVAPPNIRSLKNNRLARRLLLGPAIQLRQ